MNSESESIEKRDEYWLDWEELNALKLKSAFVQSESKLIGNTSASKSRLKNMDRTTRHMV